MSEIALKPCPFCGGEAYQHQIGNEHTRKCGYKVGCLRCRISITDLVLRNDLEWIRPRNAANWNTRITPASSSAG